jgi:hypothetical protein
VQNQSVTQEIEYHLQKGAKAFVDAGAASKALGVEETNFQSRVNALSGNAQVALTLVAVKVGSSREAKTAFLAALLDVGIPEWRAKRLRACAFDPKLQEIVTKGAKPNGDIAQTKAIANAKAGKVFGTEAAKDYVRAYKSEARGDAKEKILSAPDNHYLVVKIWNLLQIECKTQNFSIIHDKEARTALRRAVGCTGLLEIHNTEEDETEKAAKAA